MNNIILKRKFRYTLEGTLPGGKFDPFFVRLVTSPKEPTPTEEFHCIVYEMDIDNAKVFWNVVQSSLIENAPFAPDDKLGTFKLTIYDGCGVIMETRTISEAYFSKCAFEDYSDCLTYKFYIRYRKLEVFTNPEYEKLSSFHLPTGISGLGFLGPKKTQCPNCQYEFTP